VEVSAELASITPDLRQGSYCRLSVTDDGCGMDGATLERIFDPFFTTKPPGEGTGLGLSVVHGIVKSHGGAVSVYSALGRGTSFHLYFPAVRGPLAQPATKAQDAAKGGGERVLYVDDDEALVYLATRTLEKLGYEITAHLGAAAALKDFQARPQYFDVVVTDLSMPGMSGFHLAGALLEARPGLPIIMTSGYLRPEDQQRAREIGIREMILKPNTVDELGHALNRLFKAHVAPGAADRG
jgi:CheY-like chemotaxis protein